MSSSVFSFILTALVVTSDLTGVQGLCYFPAAFQGEFVTQSIMSGVPTISYSSLSILFDSIPIWGVCHRRIGNNVILKDDTGGITCFKCFNLVLRSSNVLQVHTAGLDKCYTTEERATADCPNDITIREKRTREIMLYRTKGFMGEPAVSPTYCPINGVYSFTYSVNDGTENSLECNSHTSEIADCPYGFGFNLNFKDCSFGDMDMSFHCLGDWEGPDGHRYIALMDTQATSQGGSQIEVETRPRYRCALYTEDANTGQINLALSSDSTCTNHLRSAKDGYETLTLQPRPMEPWPAHLQYAAITGSFGGSCELPEWSQGKWEHVHVQGGTVILKDQSDFKTYTARCVGQLSPIHEDRFLIYARTQCGDEHYKCVWLKNRGENAIEFQIGTDTSDSHDESLCSDENFPNESWVTQGRTEVVDPTPYPIIGEYTGVIPDTDGLCAKLYSDCNNPEIMFYTIFNCFNRSEVFEEREYRCLGEWREDGLIYTYTERRDMIGYECFVGLVSTTSRPRKRITALPSWRQRELNNLIPGASRASASFAHSSLRWSIVAVTVVLTCFT
ncbi:uncharacterized protein LOC131886899 [Tigriopus californicus]|nr:uncharacterized protein LOC131886899 [Tigriopus californicus]